MVRISIDLLLEAYLKTKYTDDPFYDFRGVYPYGLGMTIQYNDITIFYNENTLTVTSKEAREIIDKVLDGATEFEISGIKVKYDSLIRVLSMSKQPAEKRYADNFMKKLLQHIFSK